MLTRHSFIAWQGNADRSKKKSAKSELYHYLRGEFDPHRLLRSVHRSIIILAQRSLLLFRISWPFRLSWSDVLAVPAFLIILALLVVLAFQSFRLFSLTDFFTVNAFKKIKLKKEKRGVQFAP